jgi:integrase
VFQRTGSTCWWIAYYHRGKEIRESSGSDELREAEKLLRHRLKEIGADQLGARPFIGPTPERMLMSELLDALETHYKLQRTLSPQVVSHLKPIREAFADRRAVNVTAERIDQYIEERIAGGKAPATVNRETQLLHQAFRLAVDRGRLVFMPKVRHLDESGNVRQGFFERDEFEAVVVNLPEHLRDYARFAYFSGWRKSEIASLMWADVDGQVIRLRADNSKNKRPRQVPLVGPFKTIIERRWIARQYVNQGGTSALSPYVFHREGLPIGDFRKAWTTACKAAGCPGRLVHDFCRTAMRNMVRAGVPETVAMAIAGRRTRAIFDRYNITSGRDQIEAVRRTEDYVNAMPTGQAVRALPVAQGNAAQ